MGTARSLGSLALLFLANGAGKVGKKKANLFLVIKTTNVWCCCEEFMKSYVHLPFVKIKILSFLKVEQPHHMAGLKWAVSLRWFAVLLSGVKEEEG